MSLRVGEFETGFLRFPGMLALVQLQRVTKRRDFAGAGIGAGMMESDYAIQLANSDIDGICVSLLPEKRADISWSGPAENVDIDMDPDTITYSHTDVFETNDQYIHSMSISLHTSLTSNHSTVRLTWEQELAPTLSVDDIINGIVKNNAVAMQRPRIEAAYDSAMETVNLLLRELSADMCEYVEINRPLTEPLDSPQIERLLQLADPERATRKRIALNSISLVGETLSARPELGDVLWQWQWSTRRDLADLPDFAVQHVEGLGGAVPAEMIESSGAHMRACPWDPDEAAVELGDFSLRMIPYEIIEAWGLLGLYHELMFEPIISAVERISHLIEPDEEVGLE